MDKYGILHHTFNIFEDLHLMWSTDYHLLEYDSMVSGRLHGITYLKTVLIFVKSLG
jgi:hypothetical protein